DLLQHTRLMLFVEGPHDEIILRAFLGDELDRARIRIVVLHGLHNVPALLDSELVEQLGIPLAVLADNIPPDRRRSRPTAESEAVDRVVQEARATGRVVHQFGLERRDILQYLHVDACRSLAPDFPGWPVASAEWRRSGSSLRFKEFVRETYGLKLDR